MSISKEELIAKLNKNHGSGFVGINGNIYEVTLLPTGQIEFTGSYWTWEQEPVPSSHGDYTILTDVLVQRNQPDIRYPGISSTIEFYEQKENFLF